MKTDLEVEVEVDLRPLGKVLIFRDRQTHRTFLLYIDPVNHNLHLQHDLHNFFKNWDMKGEPCKTKDAEFSSRVSLSNFI